MTKVLALDVGGTNVRLSVATVAARSVELTPQLRMAVISLLRASRPSVSKVATKMANGATWNEMLGILSPK